MSIQKRERGGREGWVVRWLEDGRHRSRTFDLKKHALAFETAQRQRLQMGAHAPAEPSKQRLGEWLGTWWAREALTWARSTRLQRAGVLDRHVVPYLEGVRLRDLGTARVREWRSALVAAGCPPTTANHALAVLSAALGAAARDGLLPGNPCTGVRKLPVAVARPRALTPAEVERIRVRMPTLRDVVLLGLMAYAGLRPGEALALTWGSVGAVLVVDRAVSEGELRQTKSNRRRTVEVIEPLAADLALLRPRVADPDALVCPGLSGQPLHLRNWTRRAWRTACDEAGVTATPYDGRHTFASLLLHEGRPLPYITAALGHASATTTLDHYAHLFDEARLAPNVPMVDAIRDARRKLEEAGLRPACADGTVRVLRAPARRAKSGS